MSYPWSAGDLGQVHLECEFAYGVFRAVKQAVFAVDTCNHGMERALGIIFCPAEAGIAAGCPPSAKTCRQGECACMMRRCGHCLPAIGTYAFLIVCRTI